jgi:hypothetical protein
VRTRTLDDESGAGGGGRHGQIVGEGHRREFVRACNL